MRSWTRKQFCVESPRAQPDTSHRLVILVLQWSGSSIGDCDAMIELEDRFRDVLPDESELDGMMPALTND